MSESVQFWFEFASTYSYPAAMRIEAVLGRAGVAVEYRPFLLGPIFARQGWNDSPFNIYEAKGRYMWRDLERLCEKYGLGFRRPSVFPRGSVLAARVALSASDAPWLPEFVRRVYRASFVEDADISTREVVGGILRDLGQDDAGVISGAETPDNKNRLREQTDEAMRLGIFGAPTFVVGTELFWGNDRLEDAAERALRQAP